MTFKDLQRVIESEIGSTKAAESNQILLQKRRGKPFWYWDQRRHKERDRVTKGDCCMQHR
ncbi:MAG: hypothetical protein WCE99_10310 [Nitrososphaeraceae archaeon]